MSILIKDMQMPKIRGEYVFLLYVDSDGTATVEGAHSILKGEPFEAVPVPPHGRLGDLDELENGLRHMAKYQYGERQQGILGCCETIRTAPTIIEASNKDVDATVKEET